MPVYFRYVAGNIVDVSTLITTVSELEQYGVSVNHAILDAEYFSERNAAELFESGIPFMTRLAPNRTLFKDAAAGNLDDLMSQKYADLLPIRVQSEQAFAGHLLVCFIATAIMQRL